MTFVASCTTGLIGRGIGGSGSPAIHEAEARELGLPLTYRIVDFEVLQLANASLGDVVRFLAGIGWQGVNVTHPFKQAVLPFCHSISEEAALLGAVNTMTFAGGQVRGDNTDCIGFSWMIEQQIGWVAGTRIAQVGAGGAGSATAFAMARLGVAEIALFDPSRERAEALSARLAPQFPACRFVITDTAERALHGRQGIVQSTPVGMAAHPGVPFAIEHRRPGQWLADVIYFPRETELLAAARSCGMTAINGTGMVIGQAAEAFRLFNGLAPDRQRMLARLVPDD